MAVLIVAISLPAPPAICIGCHLLCGRLLSFNIDARSVPVPAITSVAAKNASFLFPGKVSQVSILLMTSQCSSSGGRVNWLRSRFWVGVELHRWCAHVCCCVCVSVCVCVCMYVCITVFMAVFGVGL